MSSVSTILSEVFFPAAMLAVAIAGVVVYKRNRLQKNLLLSSDERENTARAIADFSAGTVYYNALSKSLAFVRRHLGSPGSALAFSKLTALALCYSWCIFGVDWLLGGSGSLWPHVAFSNRLSGRPIPFVISTIGALVPCFFAVALGKWIAMREQSHTRYVWRILVRLFFTVVSIAPFLIVGFGARAQSDRDITIIRFRLEMTETDALFLAVAALILIVFSSTLVGDLFATIGKSARYTVALAFIGSALMSVVVLSIYLIYLAVFGDLLKSGVSSSAEAKLSTLRSVAFFGCIGAATVSLLAGWRPAALLVVGVAALGLFTALLPDTFTWKIISSIVVFSIGSGFFTGFLGARSHRKYGSGPGRAGPYMALMGAVFPLSVTVVLLLWFLDRNSMDIFLSDSSEINEGSILSVASAVILFLIVLPLFNGVFDWISWMISRYLGEHLKNEIKNTVSKSKIFVNVMLHSIADLVAAIGFLAVLAFALGFGFGGLTNTSFLSEEDIRRFVEAAVTDPWKPGKGLWYSAMLVSTLFPTAVHFLFLLASPIAIVAAGKRKRKSIADKLRNWECFEKKEQKGIAADASEARYRMVLPIFFAVVAFVVIVGLLWLLIEQVFPRSITFFGNFALFGAGITSGIW